MAEIGATQWIELSPLLDELLELQGEARAQKLTQIRRESAALAMQLQTLLGERTAIERDAFLEGAAFSAITEPSLAGHTFGAYTLERPLGEGGMGSVWLGRRSDGRYEGKVAVKFLNLALLARGGAERFAREGSMLARLTHPNIARLLDAGVTTSATVGGQPYLVLEYIEGVPIDRYCDSNALPIDKRLHLFLNVLAAVAHAHTNLILHRDLKPSNILVTAQGQVKLLDFGIGKLLAEQDTAASATALTQLAGHAFTPDYAAPEQVQSADVTTATDVYSLGVLLYQLLAGRHPTALPTQTAVDRVRAVVEKEPALVSDAAANADDTTAQARATAAPRLARSLRGDLDNIVAKALKKQAAERYPTVAALAEDLRRYLDHEPVSARADSLTYRASKFVRRYRLAVGAASATLLALLAGVVGTTWQAWEAQTQRDLAQQARVEAEAQAQRATAQSEEAQLQRERAEQALASAEIETRRATEALREADRQSELARASATIAGVREQEARRARDATTLQLERAEATGQFLQFLLSDLPTGGKPFTTGDLIARGDAWVGTYFAGKPDLQAEMLLMLATLNVDVRGLQVSLPLNERAYKLTRTSSRHDLRARATCDYAARLAERGASDRRALDLIESARAELAAHGNDVDGQVACLTSLSLVARHRFDSALAIRSAQEALALTERYRGADAERMKQALSNVASSYSLGGRYVEARDAHARALALLEKLGQERTLVGATMFNNAGQNLFAAGVPLSALPMFERALNAFRAASPGAPLPATIHNNFANALVNTGRATEAIPVFEEVVRTATERAEQRAVTVGLYNLGGALRESGNLDGAADAMRRSAEMATKTMPPDSQFFRLMDMGRARLAQARGDHVEAVHVLRPMIAWFDTKGTDSGERAVTLAVCARSLARTGAAEEAATKADAAHRMARQVVGDIPHSALIGLALLATAEAAQARGDAARARVAAKEALDQFEHAIGPAAIQTRQTRELLASLQ